MGENCYNCGKCGDEWLFIPEDYDYTVENYPEVCPLCSMPVIQMIRDVYLKEDIMEVLRMLWIRTKKYATNCKLF